MEDHGWITIDPHPPIAQSMDKVGIKIEPDPPMMDDR